jgi:hypothetical protein
VKSSLDWPLEVAIARAGDGGCFVIWCFLVGSVGTIVGGPCLAVFGPFGRPSLPEPIARCALLVALCGSGHRVL